MRTGAPTPPAKKAPRALPFQKNRFADRGAVAEEQVKKFLLRWVGARTDREASRLLDSKSAGRVVRAAPADFEFFCVHMGVSRHGLIEVKETKHDYRLDRSRLTQDARLRRRAAAGGLVYVLVFHSTLGRWRCMTLHDLGEPSKKGSWDLRHLPLHESPGRALQAAYDMWEAEA